MTLVATQVKRRRGTTAENDAFTGAEGEIVVDTERHELRVHDGSTVGGYRIPTKDYGYSKTESDNLLSNKADTSLSNITPAGKEVCASMTLPDTSRYTELTLAATDTNYTAPADGWFSFDARIAGVGYGAGLTYANNGHFESRSNCSATNQVCGVVIPVNKGQIITISYSTLATTNPRANLRFYYAKGAQ